MIVSDLCSELEEMQADNLPVMLVIEGLWFEVSEARFDEDRVVLTIEAR